MTLYAHNLPAHVRARLPQPTPMARARRAADRTEPVKAADAALWFVCKTCGAEHTSWRRAEDHGVTFHHPTQRLVWLTDDEGDTALPNQRRQP